MVKAFALAFTGAVASASIPPTITIAPGVEMPMLSFGIANHTLFIEHGGRGLDTGLVYGDDNQRETGQAAINSGLKRSDLFVIDKIPCCTSKFPDHICDPGARDPSSDITHDYATIGLDYVDVMMLHWPCDSMEATVAAYTKIEKLVASGKARTAGVSNFNATFLEAFVKKVTIKPALNQVGLAIGSHTAAESLWGRDDVTFAKTKELGITPMAFAPLGSYMKWIGDRYIDIFHDPTVSAVAAAHNRSNAQIGLRWVAQHGIPLVTRSSSAEHIDQDFEIYDFELTSEEMDRLSALQPSATTITV